MMIEPPIDKLIKKAPCRYALVCGLAKRAKEINATCAEELEQAGEKAISRAAREIYDGKVLIHVDENK